MGKFKETVAEYTTYLLALAYVVSLLGIILTGNILLFLFVGLVGAWIVKAAKERYHRINYENYLSGRREFNN